MIVVEEMIMMVVEEMMLYEMLCTSQSIHPSIFPSIHLPINLYHICSPFHLPIHPIHLFIFPFIYTIYTFIHTWASEDTLNKVSKECLHTFLTSSTAISSIPISQIPSLIEWLSQVQWRQLNETYVENNSQSMRLSSLYQVMTTTDDYYLHIYTYSYKAWLFGCRI